MDKIYTFLFTDIEGSTQLWDQRPQAMSSALAYHDTVMQQTIAANRGRIFKTVGDGVCAVFDSASDALQAALTTQALLYKSSTRTADPLMPLSVRMGLYSGPVEERANDYFGTTVNRVSRVMNAANGGQILISSTTKDLLSLDVELRDLGSHRLRDLSAPEHIFQAISPNVPLNSRPIRTLSPRRNNLPAQLTSLVGRERNVTEVCRLLRQPAVRLLTLVGPGGIGKTRLSIQVGMALLDEYEDGVYFIPMAPINSPEAIIQLMAQALKIQEQSSSLLDLVKTHLQSRQILFIFDNFEHVLEASPLVNELLVAAANVKVLTTSRESLFIYGERTYPVPPLALPEPGAGIDQIWQSAAVALFVERIEALQEEITLSDETAPDIVKICRQLDGLPLALELAAARVRDLALSEIAEQLTQRLAVLSKGPRDMPTRQRTMRGAIEWSYNLLSSGERRAFARLGVFDGSFFVDAAKSVTGIPDLAAFSSKSLLYQSPDNIISMLAVIREYALERLDDFGEVATMREKHGVYYRQWLEAVQLHLNGRDQIQWFSNLDVEQYNLQTALTWFMQEQDIDSAGQMVAVLWRYWGARSLLSAGQAWMDQVLAYADDLAPLLKARITQGAGRLELLLNQYARAAELQQTSLALYKTLDNQAGQAAVLLSLGDIDYVRGNHAQAGASYEASLSLFRALNDQAGIGRCLENMGKIATQNQDFARAETLLREGLALARSHGSTEGIALTLYDLASVLRSQEKYQEAESAYRESLALYRELNFTIGIAVMLYNLGSTLTGLGNHAAALKHFSEALNLLQTSEEVRATAECLIGIAGEFLYRGKRTLSIKTLSAARAILESLDVQERLNYADQVQYDRTLAAAQRIDADDDAEGQTAWAAGQSTLLDQIIKEVLRELQYSIDS